MATIYVKNGDWDEARAKLQVDMDKRRAQFDSKFAAAFTPAKKTPEPTKADAPTKITTPSGSMLSRSRMRG